MLSLDGGWYYSTDTVRAAIDPSKNDGVVALDDGSSEFHWDATPTVDADDVPSMYRAFFDAEEYVKLNATVVKSIPQTYVVGGDEYTFKKPPEELKKAAWSLDNKPWTLEHPDTKLVRDTDQIRGFWKNPVWDGDAEETDLSLYFPANDDEARNYVANNDNVSIGFLNKLVRADEDGVDAYQTNLYVDHVASVSRGRCSDEDGCGIQTDHHHTIATNVDPQMMVGTGTADSDVVTDASKFVNEDTWYAVPPSDNPDDEWKFPIDNCSDVSDAWKLRGQGDISIAQSTLESRIKRRASDLGCSVPESDSIELSTDSNTFYQTMSDGTTDCDCGSDGDVFSVGDMTFDAVRSHNDSVDQKVAELEEKIAEYQDAAEALESVREAVDADDDASVTDAVEAVVDARESAEDSLSNLRESKADEMRQTIVDHPATDFDEDDLAEKEYEWLDDKVSFLDELDIETEEGDETSATTADGGGDGGTATEEVEIDYNVQY